MKKGSKDNYELHSRMDQIDDAFPDPGPEVWPKAARVIQEHCPDDAAEMLAMVIDPDQAAMA